MAIAEDAAKLQTAGSYSEAENQHLRPDWATRCTDSRETWHGRAERVSWPCEISPQSVHGVAGTHPPKVENFHFW